MSDNIKADVEGLLNQYHKRAILLHRPYPPMPHMSSRSYLGGLPQLPEDYDWPVGKVNGDPVPLHFVAQIACDELPAEQTDLPKRGTLFFFVSMSEEMLWGDSGNPNDDCRVIYCEHVPANTPERAMPDNLPPICNVKEFGWNSDTLWRSPTDGRIYTKWPLNFHMFDNYPQQYNYNRQAHNHDEDFWKAYRHEENRRTGESLMACTGQILEPPTASDWVNQPYNAKDVQLPDDVEGTFFPQCGAIIEEITARVLHAAKRPEANYQEALASEARRMKREERQRAKQIEKLNANRTLTKKLFGKQATLPPVEPRKVKKPDYATEWKMIEDTCEKWLHIADKLGPAGVPDQATRETFKAWLMKLGAQRVKTKEGHAHRLLQLHKVLFSAMRRIIQRCAHDPELCAIIPPQYFNDLADRHRLVSTHENPKNAEWEGVYQFERHQMLGYFPSSQDTIGADAKDISLLHLYSDYGMNFMFCDCGEAHIFISPEDLRAGRFDKAYAHTQGG